MTETLPLIIFVPGMKPKPPPALHHDALLRCLSEGLRRVAPDVAKTLDAHPECFVRADWTWVFYQRYRDIAIDLPGIDALIAQKTPSEVDRNEAMSLATRLTRYVFLLGDALPFLINSLAGDDMRVTLADVARYVDNRKGIGDEVRSDLIAHLRDAALRKRPVLLIGHSLGSVISWDALWELSRKHEAPVGVDMFMTLGSPLGNRVIQRGLRGRHASGIDRYPDNINRWVNMVAYGELTALDRRMQNDYADMLSEGLVGSIEDYDVFNHYREGKRLLVHSEYGYLVNETTAGLIASWWREHYNTDRTHA
ncbi:MAG: alpha/beta fold hydrolase [Pseudomonadota bacterium]